MRNPLHKNWLVPFCIATIAAVCFALAGCGGEPQIAKGNVRLVDKLKTAVAAKRSDWLELAAKQIDQQHQSGKLSDDEYSALQPIIAEARQSHWTEAGSQMTRLLHGQHPK